MVSNHLGTWVFGQILLNVLKGTARYVGLLLAPAEGQKKIFLMLFLLILGHFSCLVVTSVTLRSNLNNFEKNPKKIKKNPKKNPKKSKKSKKKNLKTTKNIHKNPKTPKKFQKTSTI